MALEHTDTIIGFSVVMLLLSLLITTLVQMVIAIVGLRGKNLLWGVKTFLTQIAPELGDKVDVLAKKVLTHPAISHTGTRMATALSAKELIKILDDLASRDGSGLSAETKNQLDAVMKNVVPGVSPEITDKAKILASELIGKFPNDVPQIQQTLNKTMGTTRKIVADANAWFDTIMDRTTERFSLHTRWWGALFAVLSSFALHIDSLQIIKQLSTDSELRARLVQAAESTVQKAEDAFALTAQKQALASAAIKSEKKDLVAKAESNVLDQMNGSGDIAKQTLVEDFKKFTDIPSNLVTREDGETWLTEEFEASPNTSFLLWAFDQQFDAHTKQWLGKLRKSAGDTKDQLGKTGLTIVQFNLQFSDYLKIEHYFIGTFMSALLLSLGAPFWHNALKNLVNLRPLLVGKVDEEKGKQ